VPFVSVDEARGVLTPIRLAGPLHGVTFATALPPAQRATSPWEILDCRLALALDAFAEQLSRHGIVRVVHYSMYRPPPANWRAKVSPSRGPGLARPMGTRHLGALAIDAAVFVKQDGTTLDILRDFHGRIGAATCGPSAAPQQPTPEALELRQIVCDAAQARLFQVELTPNYNRPHRNHFHLEVSLEARAGVFVR
jgi:hypothetical protein